MGLRVAVDAMGGDRAPQDVIEGVRLFLQDDTKTEILLVGRKSELEPVCADLRVTIVDAPSVVDMHESASSALKNKKDSSIAVTTHLVKEKQADAMISYGNSGATVGFGLFMLGRIGGITRPGIIAPLPLPLQDGYCLLLDAGANVDCKPVHLHHFAILGSEYSRLAFGVDKPRVGLLSIGEEDSKGNELTLQTFKLLEHAPINFIGNVEGVDIMKGNADVVVCDGFVGNVILKFGEGLVEVFARALKAETEDVLGGEVDTKHKAAFLNETMSKVDYDRYGCGILAGVQGHCLIGHGRSNPTAIANGIRETRKAAENCPLEEIQKALEAAPKAS